MGPKSTQAADEPTAYTVVARRYRPRRFEDVVGQDHVVQALRNAIRLNRVTHAYLFSGTRGVGKTSIARIFAKCLNCVRGPTDDPCQVCDICQAISVGQDVDVIEIDGASNNGVEAVRELRQNAGLRPSRARFKIYYIDEVHMLSTGAFNALLKTLEEPPGHVKFFFATTEPNKIPITVLSRCQRYDFAGIAPDQIGETLAEICRAERVEADAEALQVVARRATGSMRDAQSLLEQLLSTGDRTLTADLVHRSLGTAPDDRVLDLIEALAAHDPGRALSLCEGAVGSGVQPAELLGGLLEFLRDVLVLSAGAQVPLLAAPPSLRPRLEVIAKDWPLDAVLAAQQILAEARGRLRGSPHGRLLVELALLRVARLEDLVDLGDLLDRLAALETGTGLSTAPALKKKPRPSENGPMIPVDASITAPLDLEEVKRLWPTVIGRLGVKLGAILSGVQPSAIFAPNTLVIGVPAGYNGVVEQCETAEGRARIESSLRDALGRPVSFRFESTRGTEGRAAAPDPAPSAADELAGDPLVRKVVALFDARRVHVESEDADRA